MHQMVSTPVDSSRRWWVLAIVVSAQFMFGVDAFVVNVAIPTIARELHASSAEIEAVIAIYLIATAILMYCPLYQFLGFSTSGPLDRSV